MSSVVIAGDTSGSVTLAAPSVAGTTTLTLPATSGTVVIGTTPSGTIVGTTDTQTLTNKTLTSPTITGATITVASTAAPTFRAYQNSAQNISTAVITKVTFDTENWDTNNNFASSTFTPTVAGYYQISSGLRCASGLTNGHLLLYKNGGDELRLCNMDTTNSLTGSGLVYANGSTDYFEIYTYHTSGVTRTLASQAAQTYFQAVFVRSA